MRGVRIAFLAGDRGDVDDAAVTFLEHRGHDRLAADEGAVEVDTQHLAPFLQVGLPHRLVDPGDPGIVDQDIDLAEGLAASRRVQSSPPRRDRRRRPSRRSRQGRFPWRSFRRTAGRDPRSRPWRRMRRNRSVIARPKPCAPPVTTAQRPFRSILFMGEYPFMSRNELTSRHSEDAPLGAARGISILPAGH